MKFTRAAIFAAIIAIFLGGCSLRPKPMTFDEMQLYDASAQCKQSATDMNPEQPNSMNPNWSAYYVMCMHTFGYTDQEINTLWY